MNSYYIGWLVLYKIVFNLKRQSIRIYAGETPVISEKAPRQQVISLGQAKADTRKQI